MPSSQWPAFLDARSGLPGPRANLTLVLAVAITADLVVIDDLWSDGGEYTAMCAAAALGRRAADPAVEDRARAVAADARWRVREGVVIGLQSLGDERPDVLRRLVATWAEDPDPLVQRAAVAAICEPRLLRDSAPARASVAACRRVTERYAAMSADRRRSPDARYLRQALGYCWSVAVVACPDEGVEAFRALDVHDPDIAWIVDRNGRKKRLSAVL